MGGGGGGGATATKVFVLFAALVALVRQANGASDLVHQWCQRTLDYNDLCVSIIEADPRSDLKNTPNGLCAILRDRAVADAVTTSTKISDLLKKETNLYGIQCLQGCSESYQRSVTKLRSADFTVMNRQNYLDLSMEVANGYYEPKDCEECFTERPGTPPSQLTSDNQNLEDITTTIVTIINLVVCNKVEAC